MQNQVSANVVPGTDAKSLRGFIGENVKDGSKVYTDDHGGYIGLPNVEHETIRHSAREYVREQIHTNGIESFLVNAQARLRRHVPPHEREAPRPLCE